MTGYGRGEAEFGAPDAYRPAALQHKDYTVPLHVDCSIEYELPDCAKPPQGVKIEPLLMIHPSHFRRLESLRRVPFVNNLPRAPAGVAVTAAAAAPGTKSRPARPTRRCCRAAPAPPVPVPVQMPAQQARPEPDKHRARIKPHPYLDCDISALPAPLVRYDRTLHQLPIYM